MEDKVSKSTSNELIGGRDTYYGWNVTQHVLTPGDNNYGNDLTVYGDRACKEGDIIEMILDLNKLQLRYNLNGECQGIAFENVEKCEYIVGIEIYGRDNILQLLSYQSVSSKAE